MNIFIDTEWFHTQKIFLIGYAYNLKIKGQLYDKQLTKKNFLNLIKPVKESNGYIFFYGPDIGMLEKNFNIDIRNNYKCCNILKLFKRNLKLKSYKLAYIEKIYGLNRSMPEYKTNIFRMIRDWNNPKYRQRALIYNYEDVINLIKVFRFILKKHNISLEKINDCILK